jgi:phosphoribosylaminoimidazole (AIR) synthetase
MYRTTKPYTPKILEIIKTTWQNKTWCIVNDDYNYPTIQLTDTWLCMDHTDGIGTKGYYHWNEKSYRAAAIDAFAMNANDLAMYGCRPFKLQNHIFLPEDNDNAIYEIVESLANLSNKYDIVMTGGETSIHNNMNGMDISITMSGIVQSQQKHQYKIGDVLIGIPSSGLHSNGFTLVHNKIGGGRKEYTEPTRIYTNELSQIYHKLNAVNHITGGAYTKLKPSIPKDANVVLRFTKKPSQIFIDLYIFN